MRAYFDSSAFAKRYLDESGTDVVLAWCEKTEELVLSVVAIPELISASCRLRHERRLTDGQYQDIRLALLDDIRDALICGTSAQVIQYAVKVLQNHALRGMDAIHVGAALVCEAEVFLSADVRQCQVARAHGLQVIAL